MRTFTPDQKKARASYLSGWRKANPEKSRAQKRRYAKRHPDRIKAKDRRRYLRKRAFIIARARFWQITHPTKAKAIRRRYQSNHREQNRLACIARYRRNPEPYKRRAKRWISFNRNEHNSHTRKTHAKAVSELRDWHVIHKLNRLGIKPTSRNIRQYKLKIRLWRTQRQFKLMATAGALLK